MSKEQKQPNLEAIFEGLIKVLTLLPEKERLEGLDKVGEIIPSPQSTLIDAQGEGHNVFVFNGNGNNTITLEKGGWSSKKRGTQKRAATFKVQDKGPYLGNEWVPVYEHVRTNVGLWQCKSEDGNLLPEHKGREWKSMGAGLALTLGTGSPCPDGYYEVKQDQLSYCSGPEGTRLGFRKPVLDKAIELGLVVADADTPDTSDTPQAKTPDTATTDSYFT